MQREIWEGTQGVYIISVAARLLEMHPQTLRKYERAGFLSPSRTEGMLRLYSAEDIARLRLIKHLVEILGLNLAGVELGLTIAQHVFQMERDLAASKVPDETRAKLRGSLAAIETLLGLAPERQEPHPQRKSRGVRIEIHSDAR